MGPAQAILSGLFKGLQFSGRTSRADFWAFVPVGLALPLSAAILMPPEIKDLASFGVKLLITSFAAAPLAAAAARRFQDTGLPADDLWQGMRPTVIVIVSGHFLLVGITGIFSIVYLLWGIIFFLGAFLPFVIYLVIMPGTLGMTIGQLLLPSQPGPNRYGPNPLEVPQ